MKWWLYSIGILISTGLIHSAISFAQSDSLSSGVTQSLHDSSRVTPDSASIFLTKNSTDTLISYVAKDSAVYRLKEKKMMLYGNSSIEYGDFHIESQRTTINWDESTLLAQGVPDTTKGREGKKMGTPKFKQGSEAYSGEEMVYNFKTKKGTIIYGETKLDDGFYLGEKIKRMSDDVYFIRAGQYTTCDNPDHKHYYFGSPKMKFVPQDVVIAEPIALYIEDVPVFWFPFAVIPSKGGRQSGIIIPTFGEVGSRGRYLKGGGYYWAMSDYTDLSVTADWYSKGGYQINSYFQYNWRYHFSGSIDMSYGRQQFNIGDPYRPDDLPGVDYKLSISHNQEIDPTTRVNVNFSFLTNSYFQKMSTNLQELLQQEVRSSANFSTSWEGTNRSMNVNISRNQYLRTGTSNNTLPSISFSQSQIFPFRRKGSIGEKWYEMIGFDYNGNFQQTLNQTKRMEDSVEISESYLRRGVSHGLRFNMTPKAGYVTITPSLSYSERWYDHQVDLYYDPTAKKVYARDLNIIKAIRTFSTGLSISTKLYGMLQPNVFGILGLRHTITPSVSYNYNPDFTKGSWGYYKSYIDSLQRVIRYDPYTGYLNKPGEVFGGVGMGEQQSIGFSVGNNFEMKLKPSVNDTTQTPRKFQLLNISISTGYNVVADSFRLSPISLSYHTTIIGLLNLSGSTTYSPYVFDGKKEVDRYLIREGGGLARLTSFNVSISTNLSNETFAAEKLTEDTTITQVSDIKPEVRPYKFTLPWNISFGYDFSQSQFNPSEIAKQSSMRASLNFTLGDVWRVGASTYYDLVNKELGAPSISISRDLHCWDMRFDWIPIGNLTRFNFIIRLKASQLQDIKLEKKGSASGVF